HLRRTHHPERKLTDTEVGSTVNLTLPDGLVCAVPEDADYAGTIDLTCSDGSSISATGSALSPDAVAAATVDGVWMPVLTPGGIAEPVSVASRG
ncbi:hypothetical protein, partial [Rhodococcoides yunnanense]|uniref:hypothetical protein n=1 Tax=Rhodococcoides yunnanense TaxID=278209 RepID=UPI0022B1CFB7